MPTALAIKLSISVHIRFDQAADLRGLTGVAEAVDATGKPLVYTIADPLAESLDIRQVEFTDQLRVSVLAGKQAWVVRFALRDVLLNLRSTQHKRRHSSCCRILLWWLLAKPSKISRPLAP